MSETSNLLFKRTENGETLARIESENPDGWIESNLVVPNVR